MNAAISDACRKLLERVRRECPGLLPPDPVKAGTVVGTVQLKVREAAALFPAAASAVAGINSLGNRPAESIVWKQGDRALMIFPSRVTAKFGLGVIAVAIPVFCDQTGETAVYVTLVVGDPKRPAGLVAATETRPRGPDIIIDAWGDNLVAFAWHTVLEVSGNIAGEAGRDIDGSPLVPIGIAASPDGLAIVPMARHTFDRKRA